MYLNILKLIDEQKSEYAAKLFDSMRIKNVLYRMHINAKLSIAALNHQRARELLIQALDGTCGDADPILRYRLLNDLENVEDKNLSEKLDMIFGEDKVELCHYAIRTSGSTVL
jgi:hypothetical protein